MFPGLLEENFFMTLRIVEITGPDEDTEQIHALAEKHNAIDSWHTAKNKDGRRTFRILINLDHQQDLTDAVQNMMTGKENWRIIIQPVDATIPRPEEPEAEQNDKGRKIVRGTVTREELYYNVEKGAQLNRTLLLLVILSTLVCAIGLIKSNIAVVIGAMVIAPLLGPNLALALGAALGDKNMVLKAIKTNAAGLGLTIFLSILAGLFFPVPLDSAELIDRTDVGFDSLALALASGAAAVLSLTTGLSSALVGVMVAVALMPPAVATGLMIGGGHVDYAANAGLLLAANVVCVSLAAQIVLLTLGVKPRTWYDQRKTSQSVKLTIAFWALLLAGLIAIISFKAA